MKLLLLQTLLFMLFAETGLFLWNGSTDFSSSFIITTLTAWTVTAWLTHPHRPKRYQKKINYIAAPYFRGVFIFIVCAVLISSLVMKLDLASSVLLFSFPAVLFFLTMFVFLLITQKNYQASTTSKQVTRYQQDDLPIEIENLPKKVSINNLNQLSADIQNILNEVYQSNSSLFHQYETAGQNDWQCYSEKSKTLSSTLSLLVIEKRLNDISSLNKSLHAFHGAIKNGGLLLVNYNTIEDTNQSLRKKYPGPLYYLVFPFHWFFYRVCSKIQGLHAIQEGVSGGKNKVMSWIEVSGRLAYAGFDHLLEKTIDGKQWIVARKTKTVSDNPNPSYYLFIQLNRVTLEGNIVRINKLRSMYPYSEFLQKKIYEQNSLSNTGKFKDDPRITPQGKIFRKYWLDELPQFLDWLRGEIKLVGIRAMSQHFFSLYNDEYKTLYFQVKPGIISPIFDEETADFEEIQRIEFDYLKSYVQSPIKTDWKYFWITFSHIAEGVRSK